MGDEVGPPSPAVAGLGSAFATDFPNAVSQDLSACWTAGLFAPAIRYDTWTVRSSSQVGSKIRPQRYQLLPIRHIAAFLLATRSSFGAVISGME